MTAATQLFGSPGPAGPGPSRTRSGGCGGRVNDGDSGQLEAGETLC